MKQPEFIVVIGASAGGMNALREVVGQLKPEMNAAFFIVVHLSSTGMGSFLVRRLQPLTSVPCSIALHNETIERNHIYFAPSNRHLIVNKGQIILGHGPAENRWRPSIDVLFRSAAAAYSTHVIGVVLTGFLHDGTSGMIAIKRSGGICIVQDPNEAEYPDMPMNVLDRVEVDYSVGLARIGAVITELLERKVTSMPAPPDVLAEAEIAERTATGIENVHERGEKSAYACPDCGGGLWKIDDHGRSRYRCHVGHAYTEEDLLTKQGENLESTLWVALRMMEERSHLLRKMANDNNRGNGLSRLAESYVQRAEELDKHINTLKEVLIPSANMEAEIS